MNHVLILSCYSSSDTQLYLHLHTSKVLLYFRPFFSAILVVLSTINSVVPCTHLSWVTIYFYISFRTIKLELDSHSPEVKHGKVTYMYFAYRYNCLYSEFHAYMSNVRQITFKIKFLMDYDEY